MQEYNTENHLYEEIIKPAREKLQTAATCHASFRIIHPFEFVNGKQDEKNKTRVNVEQYNYNENCQY
jgi:hypothetical protein